MRTVPAPVAPMVAQLTLLGALLWVVGAGRAGTAVGVTCAGFGWMMLIRALADHGRRGLGPADHVTVTRGTLACVVAALTMDSTLAPATRTPLVLLAGVALALDAVDGCVARRTQTTSPLGARMDMEVDAFLILVLSIAGADVLGGWVLAIGAFRYLLVVAAWAMPWLGGSVAPRYWRKGIAALQGIVLALASAQVLPRDVVEGTVLAALALLAWSFGTQGVELWRSRAPDPSARAQGRVHGLQRAPVPEAAPGAQPVRAGS